MQYRSLTAMLAAALIIGCSESPTNPTALVTPEFDGASGCFTVQFNVAGAWKGIPWTYNDLDVTGDLEGLMTMAFDPASVKEPPGANFSNGGTSYWSITGGVIPGLGTFETTFDNMNVLPPPKWTAGVMEPRGTMRAFSGVEKANLTYKGTGKFPEAVIDLDFQGVICP